MRGLDMLYRNNTFQWTIALVESRKREGKILQDIRVRKRVIIEIGSVEEGDPLSVQVRNIHWCFEYLKRSISADAFSE
jgi:hypothetical protein